MYIRIQTPRKSRNDSKTLEQMQKVRLRQARRHRKALRTVQGKQAAILERPQESRRRGRGRVTGGIRRREDEEEVNLLHQIQQSFVGIHHVVGDGVA